MRKNETILKSCKITRKNEIQSSHHFFVSKNKFLQGVLLFCFCLWLLLLHLPQALFSQRPYIRAHFQFHNTTLTTYYFINTIITHTNKTHVAIIKAMHINSSCNFIMTGGYTYSIMAYTLEQQIIFFIFITTQPDLTTRDNTYVNGCRSACLTEKNMNEAFIMFILVKCTCHITYYTEIYCNKFYYVSVYFLHIVSSFPPPFPQFILGIRDKLKLCGRKYNYDYCNKVCA